MDWGPFPYVVADGAASAEDKRVDEQVGDGERGGRQRDGDATAPAADGDAAAVGSAKKQRIAAPEPQGSADELVVVKRADDALATAHRMRVVRALMERGISLDVLDGDLRELLEEPRERRVELGPRAGVTRDAMASQSAELWSRLVAEHRGVAVAFAFDVAPWNDDVAVVVSRVCSAHFELQHRVVAVRCAGWWLRPASWVCIVDEAIRKLQMARANVRVALTGGCNTMLKACRDLAEQLPGVVTLRCVPHLWQNTPGLLDVPQAAQFLNACNAVFAHSSAARHVFRKITRVKWARAHDGRWDAPYVQCEQLREQFAHLPAVVKKLRAQKLCEQNVPMLERLLYGQDFATSDLAVALALQCDVVAPFVRFAEWVRGDGFVAPFVMTRIRQLLTFIDATSKCTVPLPQCMPNVSRIVDTVHASANKKSWWSSRKSHLPQGLTRVWNVLRDGAEDTEHGTYRTGLYCVAELFHPVFCLSCAADDKFDLSKRLAAPDVAQLFGAQLCGELMRDWHIVVAAYGPFKDSLLGPSDLLDWWRQHSSETGAWAAAARLLMLCHPHAGLAERAGEIVRARMGDKQDVQSEEELEVSVMLGFLRAEAGGAGK